MAGLDIKLLCFAVLAFTSEIQGGVPKAIVADVFAGEWAEITEARHVPLKLGDTRE